MKQIAIAKAEKAYDRAEEAVERLKTAPFLDDAQAAWEDFLDHFYKVVTKLKAGANGRKRSETWATTLARDARKDPLLRYVYHARNSETHGLVDTSGFRIKTIGAEGGTVFIGMAAIGPDGEYTSSRPVPMNPGARLVQSYWFLLSPFTDTFGDTYVPPQSHLGKPLPDARSASVAEAALAYLAAIIDEAKGLRA